jgi:hypothetical protein
MGLRAKTMAQKKCGFWDSSHNWSTKTTPVSPGTFQKKCTRCGRIKNVRCGTFFQPHKWKRDRRIKNKRVVKCKKCGIKKTL